MAVLKIKSIHQMQFANALALTHRKSKYRSCSVLLLPIVLAMHPFVPVVGFLSYTPLLQVFPPSFPRPLPALLPRKAGVVYSSHLIFASMSLCPRKH